MLQNIETGSIYQVYPKKYEPMMTTDEDINSHDSDSTCEERSINNVEIRSKVKV